ncbi:hypothetical protein HY489_02675 [Candidatus Woesearchaeota archaeon]|nr:hypothetical protein [Candidatus Woesearchaeota archaeon]
MKLHALLLTLLLACSTTLTPEEQSYKELCTKNNHAWMRMSELKDGHPTGNTCYGCMPDEKNHLCSKEEYDALLPKHDAHEAHIATMLVHANGNRTVNIHDYSVTLQHDPLETDKELDFKFSYEKQGQPLTLQLTHSAPMHAIIVSKDLEKFYHLHPELEKPGTLSTRHIFDKPGKYRMWIEFTYYNIQHTIDFDLEVK